VFVAALLLGVGVLATMQFLISREGAFAVLPAAMWSGVASIWARRALRDFRRRNTVVN